MPKNKRLQWFRDLLIGILSSILSTFFYSYLPVILGFIVAIWGAITSFNHFAQDTTKINTGNAFMFLFIGFLNSLLWGFLIQKSKKKYRYKYLERKVAFNIQKNGSFNQTRNYKIMSLVNGSLYFQDYFTFSGKGAWLLINYDLYKINDHKGKTRLRGGRITPTLDIFKSKKAVSIPFCQNQTPPKKNDIFDLEIVYKSSSQNYSIWDDKEFQKVSGVSPITTPVEKLTLSLKIPREKINIHRVGLVKIDKQGETIVFDSVEGKVDKGFLVYETTIPNPEVGCGYYLDWRE